MKAVFCVFGVEQGDEDAGKLLALNESGCSVTVVYQLKFMFSIEETFEK
jgi:hypothetical protein